MRRALVFQHMTHDTAGRFLDLFAEDDLRPDTVRLHAGEAIPSLAPYDLLLVLGGVQDVWQEDLYPWLKAEKAAIREWVAERDRPYIGLCLGHQLLADALGGRVALTTEPEVGVFDIALTEAGQRHPLFRGLGPRHPVMEWHFAEVVEPPPGAQVLARSPRCAVQCLTVGSHAAGFQFHAEFTPQSVEGWADLPNYMAGLQRARGPTGYQDFRAEALPRMPGMAAMTRALYTNLMAGRRQACP